MSKIFDGKAFAIVGLNGAEKAKIIKSVEENGGEVHKSVKKDTDYLITKEKSVKEGGATVKSAFQKDVVVIPDNYIKDCIEKKSL